MREATCVVLQTRRTTCVVLQTRRTICKGSEHTVEMADVRFIVGVIGNVISILLYISPLKTFWCIVKIRSTKDFKCLPYICTLLSTSLWTYYGLIKPGGLLISTVNGVGVAMETVYVIIFIMYAPTKSKLKTVSLLLLVDIIFFVSVFLVTFLALNQRTRVTVIGVVCMCLTLSMYGSPLVLMKTVIVTKSVEFMPFLLSFFLFLNGGIWTIWAVLEGDVFVGIPNGIGFGLGAAQLVVYMIYRNGKPGRGATEEEDVKSNGLNLEGEDIEMDGGDELCSVDHIGDAESHPNNLQIGSSHP